MKAVLNEQTEKEFQPYEITLSVESIEEHEALKNIAFHNYTIPLV